MITRAARLPALRPIHPVRGHSGFLVYAFVLLAMSTQAAAAQTELTLVRGDARDIRMTEVAEGVYQFTTVRDSYVRLLNSVAVVTDRDVLVFDTGTRPTAARAILARIRKLTDKPVRFVVNSHGHPDHWSGNGVFAAAFPGLEIIATPQVAAHMQRMAPVWGPRFAAELDSRRKAFALEQRLGVRADGTHPAADERKQDSTDVEDYASLTAETIAIANRRVFPTLIYQDSLVVLHGGREFHLLSVDGDAEGTTVVWMPRERVLLTGDAVSFPIPYVGPHPAAQSAALGRLASLHPAVIVPGHGPAFRDTTYLALERQLLDLIVHAVAQLRHDGVTSVDEMQRRITADALREEFTHGDQDLLARFPARVRDIVRLAFSDTSALSPAKASP